MDAPDLNTRGVCIAFTQACKAAGYPLPPEAPDPVGSIRQFDLPNGARGMGFYALLIPARGHPLGIVGDWRKPAAATRWHGGVDTKDLSPRQLAACEKWFDAKIADVRQRHEAYQEEQSKRARELWEKASPAPAQHPWLAGHRIQPLCLREHGGKLLIPVYNVDGQIQSLQQIAPDGKVFSFPGAPMGQGHLRLGNIPLSKASVVIVTTSFVNGATILAACPGAVVLVAFSPSNLLFTAQVGHRKARGARLIIAADDTPQDDGTNPALARAQAAAAAIHGAELAVPSMPTWNALALQQGDVALRTALLSTRERDPRPDAQETTAEVEDMSDAWQRRMHMTDKGALIADHPGNFRMMLENHPDMRNVFHLNELTGGVEIHGPPWAPGGAIRPICDRDHWHVREWFREHGLKCSKDDVPLVIQVAADRNRFHPARAFLASLPPWDGRERIRHWLVDYCGAPETLHTALVSERFLISAVARAMQPGCKVDTMLILEGEQGAKKSTLVAELFGSALSTEMTCGFMNEQKLVESIAPFWCVEIPELAGLSQSDRNRLKAQVSKTCDFVRRPYDRLPGEHPRSCVFVGTTNDETYINDPTGGRRFWPVRVERCNIEAIRQDRVQIWAEAMHAYRTGARWWIDESEHLAETMREAVAARQTVDPWEAILLQSTAFMHQAEITTSEAMSIIGVPPDRRDRSTEMRVAEVLKGLGRVLKVRRKGSRIVRVWVEKAQ